MSAQGPPSLFQSPVLELTSAGGIGAGTVEVRDASGVPLAAADRTGRIAAPDGTLLMETPIRFEGRRDIGTNAVLDVFAYDRTPVGEVHVKGWTVTPRTRKITLAAISAGTEIARLEPVDDRGDESVVTAGDQPVGTKRKTASQGFLRKSTNYRLELTGPIDERARWLVLAAAIRSDELLAEASTADRRRT